MTIIETFLAHQNPENASGMKRYMKNHFEFLGIKTPERRALSRDFLCEKVKEGCVDWVLVDKLWALDYREFQYLAGDYLKKVQKWLTLADLERLYALAIQKSWWDLIDFLDEHVGSIVQRFPQAKATMLAWSQDDNFWIRRLAIDHQLGFKLTTDTDLLAQIIRNNFGSNEFFINKAIGWSLREYSKVAPDWVRTFITDYEAELNNLSIREGLKVLKRSSV
ncbi:MAG: DNA alkylation repair protein [Pseudolactococcus raffinolactis]|jgi:3-methyladenine DNA glycosylase AlkD|uniref:DNA alkylation repair protein n=1 Tax=Pseudolactococcus raffinolactis TaxID=1366 RepID=UPI003A5C6885